MKIYIASSWKIKKEVLGLAQKLRKEGFEVDCFCDPKNGRFVFHWQELVENHKELMSRNAKDFVLHPKVRKAGQEDRKYLDWADCVIMLLPCGNSAHLEAGYGKGAGKLVYILGDFEPGKIDVMYTLADGLFWYPTQFEELVLELKSKE